MTSLPIIPYYCLVVKKIFLLIIFIAVVISPVTIIAQTTTPPKIRLETLRVERKDTKETMRAEMKIRMEEFKEGIAQIKDERKKGLVARIVDKITKANTKIAEKMSQTLDKLTRILNSMKTKTATLELAEGQDTAALASAISAAETAISEAQTAVNEQAVKEYSANITNEAILRSSIGQMVSSFRLDIQSVHKKVVDAKQAVQKARSELVKLRGEKQATESANI